MDREPGQDLRLALFVGHQLAQRGEVPLPLRRRWRETGLIAEFHDRLRGRVREAAGREAEPSAAVIDSQPVKADAVVCSGSRGYDGGKKTFDAKNVSNSERKTGFSRGWKGHSLVERDAVRQAVVKAADHPVEEVSLGSRVTVSGLTSAVVVSPRSG